MIDATRMTKLARTAAAWTARGAHSGAALVGVAVLSLAALQVSRHGVEGLQPARLASEYGFAQASANGDDDAVEAKPGATLAPTMERVVRYLSQRYRVSSTAVSPLVREAHEVGRSMGVDPLLIIAVMAIESRFNPFAESSVGAQGLMQVMPRFHEDKLQDGEDVTAFLDPETNIRVGAQILKESIKRAGSVMGGLQRYNGNPGDPNQSYANKVMAEKARLKQALVQSPRSSRGNMGA